MAYADIMAFNLNRPRMDKIRSKLAVEPTVLPVLLLTVLLAVLTVLERLVVQAVLLD